MRIGITARAWEAPHEPVGALELGGRVLGRVVAGLPGRTALVVGTCSGAVRRRQERRDPETWDLGRFARLLAERVGLSGPTLVVSSACASGSAAVTLGHRLLRAGLVDAVVCGGVDVIVPRIEEGFRRLGATGPGFPFGTPPGMRLGQGAAFVVLRPEAGPPWLAGCGLSADPHGATAPSPDGAALHRALDRAGCGDVGLVAAHGTGTEANDAAESLVLAERFPDADVVAWKGHVGHTLGAAGALELARTLEAMASGQLPRVDWPRRAFAPVGFGRARTTARDAALLCAGFGGATSALVFGETAGETAAPGSLGVEDHLVWREPDEDTLRPGLVGVRGLADPVSRHLASATRQLGARREHGLFVGLHGRKGVAGAAHGDAVRGSRRAGARAFSALLKHAPTGAACQRAGVTGPSATLVGPHAGLLAVMWAWLEGVPAIAGGVDEATDENTVHAGVALVTLGPRGPRIVRWALGTLESVRDALPGPACLLDGEDCTSAVRALVEASEPVVIAHHPDLGAVGAMIER